MGAFEPDTSGMKQNRLSFSPKSPPFSSTAATENSYFLALELWVRFPPRRVKLP
jgi:hypothetical protein